MALSREDCGENAGAGQRLRSARRLSEATLKGDGGGLTSCEGRKDCKVEQEEQEL